MNGNKKTDMSRLFPYLKKRLHLLIVCVFFALIINFAELLKPYILMITIDEYLVPGRMDDGFNSVFWLGVMYLSCVAASSMFGFFTAFLINRVGQETLMEIRRIVFRHIQRLPMKTLDRFSSGRLITRATNDVEGLNELFVDILPNIVQDALTLIGITAMMMFINMRLALVAFLTIPLITLLTLVIRKYMRKNFERVKALVGQINGFFAENISGMRLVQIFRREKEKQAEFHKLNMEYRDAAQIQIRLNSLMMPVMDVINNFGIALLILYGMGGIENGWLELGVLYSFTTYIKQFFEPINDLAEKYSSVQSAVVSCRRIFELLDDEDGVEDLEKGNELTKPKGRIEFKNVWFAYREDEWVLQDVSFVIEPGQTAAFVGATGSGKTTVINLLTRFYEIQKGGILIDGVNINEFKLSDLRRNISVVLQDVFLFSGSIAENIRLGNAEIDDLLIKNSIERSGAEDFIANLPNGMDEPVAERGLTFSSGQRQLLSFARAIAHDPAVFVLDEATANIDTETERLIQDSITNISADRTTIIVAHRLSTIRNCDVIFVLRKGRLRERGDHHSLLALNGIYARLSKLSGLQV